jgi:hypothetical protein
MKKIVIILVLILFSGTVEMNAQDVITKKDGSEIRAKVTEVGETAVKYKLYNNLNGPVYESPKSALFMLLFEDGTKIVFNEENVTTGTGAGTGTIGTGGIPPIGQTGQDDVRKGYAGMAIGVAFLSEDYPALDKGLQLSFNFGYLFGKNIGITSSLLYNSYESSARENSNIGLVGLVAGPLFSFSTSSRKVDFDIRPQLGYVSIHAQLDGKALDVDEGALAVDLGGSVKWNVSKLVALSANLDYLYHKKFETETVDLGSFAITVGVNFKFGR